jgi:YbbR domain-containing protein
MALVKLSASERRRLSAFFTCLVLAILAWMFTTLSGQFKFGVKVVINYKNAPQRRAFHPLQSDTITDTLRTTGWEMLFQRMNYQNRSIDVDLRSLDNKDYVVLSSQLNQINNKDIEPQIISFNPDTLYFDFSDRVTKKVPVKLISGIHYQRQYAQSNNVVINPAFITVSGPEKAINDIKYWNTDSLSLDSVNETIRANVYLQPSREGNVNVYPKAVRVTLPVDEYTEKTIQIPVKLINNRNYDKVKVFPQKVNITFTTSLNRYSQMDEDFFEASADLDLWRERHYSTLPVSLTRIPAFCKIVRVEPKNIDFIIHR